MKNKEMRRFKFRVWDSAENKFLDGEDILIDSRGSLWEGYVDRNGCHISGELNEKYQKDYEDYTIQQYTGINDIDGREIYEGDILIITSSTNQSPVLVEYLAPSFGCAMGWEFLDPKIIGNIFENPEMLGDKPNGN